MLPTVAEIETSREPVKHDLYNLDNLIQDLNTPKEQMQQSRPAVAPGQNSFGSGRDGQFIDSPEIEPIPAEIAALSGKAIAGTIDTGLGFGFSVYAKNRTPEKYQANAEQRQQLNLAWAAVAQKYNYKVEDSPWLYVILLNVSVYFPAFQEAQKDHRFALQQEQIDEIKAKQKEIEARITASEVKSAE